MLTAVGKLQSRGVSFPVAACRRTSETATCPRSVPTRTTSQALAQSPSPQQNPPTRPASGSGTPLDMCPSHPFSTQPAAHRQHDSTPTPRTPPALLEYMYCSRRTSERTKRKRLTDRRTGSSFQKHLSWADTADHLSEANISTTFRPRCLGPLLLLPPPPPPSKPLATSSSLSRALCSRRSLHHGGVATSGVDWGCPSEGVVV
ncbi:hypothetical protein EV126DRAFT_434696 [Verticillium dahliae]|nr:hypothetical protein EV126DRAFT_434696 [Verticillium dahliae]